MGAEGAEGISTDELNAETGVPGDECFRILHNLESLGLLATTWTAGRSPEGVKDPSNVLLTRISAIERALVELMAESAPDAPDEDGQVVTLRPLCEASATPRATSAGRADPGRAAPSAAGDGARLRRGRDQAGDAAAAQGRAWTSSRSGSRARGSRSARSPGASRGRRGRPRSAPRQAACVHRKRRLRSSSARRASSSRRSRQTSAGGAGQGSRCALEQALLYLHETGVVDSGQGPHVFRRR